MPSKTSKKKPAATLPSIPKELFDQMASGPLDAEAVNAASMAFKKALIERMLGAELGHHLGYPPAPEAGFSLELGCDAQSNEFSLVLTYCCDKRNLLACGNHSLTSVPFVMNTVSSNTRMMERICHLAKAELLEAPPVTQFGNKAVIEARYCCMKFHIHPQYFSSAL